MKNMGVCLGSTNISIVTLEKNNGNITEIDNKVISHEGNPRAVIESLIDNKVLENIDNIIFTGRQMRSFVKASSISEPEAIEVAYQNSELKPNNIQVIVSAGGEMLVVYKLDKKGKIIDLFSGNKCASGTGEFFLQQLKRMDTPIEKAIEMADRENPYKVSGRCSVFCKSDCTHALNKGSGKEKIIAGLCEMMAGKVMELIKTTQINEIMVIGGLSGNTTMLHYLEKDVEKIHIPQNSKYFEAYGAALWGFENDCIKIKNSKDIFEENVTSFAILPELSKYEDMVEFKTIEISEAVEGERSILGIDVGSTTTKAVLLATKDNKVIANCYLRTNGDPVGAARECYKKIMEATKVSVKVIGLGVTGSGRSVVGLHAATDGIINEIIAHATAAAFFDKEVDTIFEIGGQDAKYTYLTNGAPSDYAMNEACSAGTGSFLEESAYESLGIETKDIGDFAMLGVNPPNFSEQCSAFISSDIKRAIQEGMTKEDITAGLVYSICLNYVNRVKGNRSVGKKIFMQGGVCYNKSIPIAMAALTGKKIIVPPEPGLMGAFGVALDIKNKLNLGLLEEKEFDLSELLEREVEYLNPFVCSGGIEKCDLKCKISRIEMNGKVYPFGGACNKYTAHKANTEIIDKNEFDYVAVREKLLFEKYGREFLKEPIEEVNKKVGLNNSLLMNTLFPLYYNFFSAMGFEVVLSDNIEKEGIDKKGAAFCYPVEIAHGMMENLVKKDLDFYFLPHVKSLPIKEGGVSVTCPFVQGEAYYLKSAFDELTDTNLIDDFFEFNKGYDKEIKKFINIGKRLGISENKAKAAYEKGVEAQLAYHKECHTLGKELLEMIENSDDKYGVIVFGRPYNAFARVANMGIPSKFASKGRYTIPVDFLPYKEEELEGNMYWAMGRIILKGAQIVKKSDKLFGAFISNFSCGPDSFVIGDFRKIMGDKPSLTLELDSHTADAGVDTRIEAFLDIVKSYCEMKNSVEKVKNTYKQATTVYENKKLYVIDSNGNKYDLRDKKVKVVFPAMGKIGNRFVAAAMKYRGINTVAMDEPQKEELSMGKNVSLCKECMPLMLTTGTLMKYLKDRETKDEIVLYFMPETSGPCRFGQYKSFINTFIEKEKIENVAVLSLSADNGYAGLGKRFSLRTWQGIVIDEVLEEIYGNLLVLAKDKKKSIEIYNKVVNEIVESLSKDSWSIVKKVIEKGVEKLSEIEVKHHIKNAKKIALVGEIYVRRDSFSKRDLVEKMAEKDVVVKVAPALEWIHYCDYLVKNRISTSSTERDKYRTLFIGWFKEYYEKTIKNAFGKLEFYEPHIINIEKVIKNSEGLISEKLTGEAILTVGAAINEIVDEVSGVINIGPFGCMPSRIAEAVLNEKLEDKKMELSANNPKVMEILKEFEHLPFMSIEVDGSPFSQLVEAKLESFLLQVDRVHNKINQIV